MGAVGVLGGTSGAFFTWTFRFFSNGGDAALAAGCPRNERNQQQVETELGQEVGGMLCTAERASSGWD